MISQNSDGVHCARDQYPLSQEDERSYTSVLDPRKALFQVGEVIQEFQQRTDGSAFTVVIYFLNGVKTLVDVPRFCERIPNNPPRC